MEIYDEEINALTAIENKILQIHESLEVAVGSLDILLQYIITKENNMVDLAGYNGLLKLDLVGFLSQGKEAQ